jgi:selenocysteine lyase/cysteine desulfurase
MEWFEKFRAEFPVVENEVYVDVALINPLATRVVEKMCAFLKHAQTDENEKKLWETDLSRTRGKLAKLINAKPNEICFTKNTAEGINILAQGTAWEPMDNVVVADQEHPNNVLPWLNRKKDGLNVRIVSAQDYRLPVDLIWSAVDSRTRAIAVSFVQYCSGFRSNIIELGRRCRETNIFLLVDGIQAIGVLDTDVKEWGVHALACGGHKTLLAPLGIGFLYCREDLLEALRPAYVGTSSVIKLNRKDWAIDVANPRDAQRLELGTLNYPGIFGLDAGLDLLLEAGISNIEKRVLRLSKRLNSGLRQIGYKVISSENPDEQSGIVSVTVPAPQAFIKYLRSAGIRACLMDAGMIRFSLHAYNLDWEIERILEVSANKASV